MTAAEKVVGNTVRAVEDLDISACPRNTRIGLRLNEIRMAIN